VLEQWPRKKEEKGEGGTSGSPARLRLVGREEKTGKGEPVRRGGEGGEPLGGALFVHSAREGRKKRKSSGKGGKRPQRGPRRFLSPPGTPSTARKGERKKGEGGVMHRHPR